MGRGCRPGRLAVAVVVGLAAAAAAAHSFDDEPKTKCKSVSGVVFGFGHNLQTLSNSTTAEDCCTACDAAVAEGCVAWTYHKTALYTCVLHSAATPTEPMPGAISGVVSGEIPPAACVGVSTGCFKDFIPAPGVPAVRALDSLAVGPVANMSVEQCAKDCAARGYIMGGVTTSSLDHDSASRTNKQYWCYCGCSINGAATELSNATCASPCADAPPGDGPCGADGAMATFTAECTPWGGIPPPPPRCDNGSKPLPPGPACSQPQAKKWKFCDTAVPLNDRVTDLVNRITMPEAGALLTARESPAIPRLGIPAFYWGTNAVHGVTYGNATTFPEALNMGCTWNRTAMRGFGRTIGREMRALNNLGVNGVGLTSWSPTINLIRDPRWGRNQETISEDPLLAGEHGAQASLGLQYDRSATSDAPAPSTPSSGEFMAVATLKHVTAYSLEQWSPDGNWSEAAFSRQDFNAELTPYDLADSYSPMFARAIGKGGAAGVMYACNMVNGVPAVASADLAARLRSWGFTGYRTTDGGGIGAIAGRQKYTETDEEGIKVALMNGESDIDDGGTYQEKLISAIEAGLNVSYVRRALFNTFRIRFRLGLFDPVEGQPWRELGMKDVATPAARQLNVEAAQQSLVLLKNADKTLPLRVPPSGDVVVVGASANSTRVLGGGHYARSIGLVDGFETGGYPSIPVAIQSVLAESGSSAAVKYFQGLQCRQGPSQICPNPKWNETLAAAAVQAAQGAKQVVVVVNLQSVSPCHTDEDTADGGEFNPCGYEAEQSDRPGVGVPLLQARLAREVLEATAAAGVPTVMVLVHGGAMAIEEFKVSAPAILDAHYPGLATGARAVADALYGEFSPAGKLPYSVMPLAWDNISNFSSMSVTDPPGRTYRYYPTDPSKYPPVVYPFGWGLTYTTVEITLAAVSAAEAAAVRPWAGGTTMTRTVLVSNTGGVDSDEVVQVYFAPQFKRQGVPTPRKQLIDFERVHVKAGSTVSVPFTVNTSQLELVNADGSKGPHPGAYKVVFTNGVNATTSVDVEIQ